MNRTALLIIAALIVLSATAHTQPAPKSQVPFIGCKSDGQIGPRRAPSGKFKTVAIAPEVARRLAYYKGAYGPGALAPRGWYCFETYGSSGQSLYVSPVPINSNLFSDSWKGFSGPAIELSEKYGDTSGRFEVAATVARLFPAHKQFVDKVIAEGIEPASSFPSGPYPSDKLAYRGSDVAEYLTPAEQDGLGTDSRLLKNGDPIRGVVILVGEEPNVVHLSARLQPAMSDLAPTIIQQVELDAKAAN